MRITIPVVICLTLVAVWTVMTSAQSPSDLDAFFRQSIGLNSKQLASIQDGKAVSLALEPRNPAEVFVFGAVYVNAAPESYVRFSRDFERLGKVPGYLAIKGVSNPPQLSDFNGFVFEREDIKALRECKPGDCEVQIPSSSLADIQKFDWSAPNVEERFNLLLKDKALERLTAYIREGNRALGVYNDKPDPVDVTKQFEYMLSYSKVLPRYLPDFYGHLLTYPQGKPPGVEDDFYWSRVEFGLKPTLRMVQVLTLRGNPDDALAYAIAEKQLYSSHYFQTALDLTFCMRSGDPKRTGFYLIKAMGSEQAGLTGIKGSIVRRVAVDRSVSSLEKSLAAIKSTLETEAKNVRAGL